MVELVLTNPDLVYADQWKYPRFAPEAFRLSLFAVYKEYYGMDIEYTQYGKPLKGSFDFAERRLRRLAQS